MVILLNIVELPTCFIIENVRDDIKAAISIMDDLTAIDYDGIPVPLGYKYDPIMKPNKMNIYSRLIVPKGYTLAKIQSKTTYDYTYEKIDYMEPEPLGAKWTVNKTPFDYQDEIITTIMRAFNKGDTQYIIDLVGGKGKTLTSLFIASMLGVPTLVICKSTELISQWVDNLMKKTDLKTYDVYQLKGGGSVTYVESLSNGITHPIYIATHATIRSIISTYGYIVINKMLAKMGIGLKIIDEFDTEFANIMDIDLNTMVRYNLYLTATVYKNNKSEDKVFQNAFKSVKRIGREMFPDEKPNRTCDWVISKSHPDPTERNMVYNFKTREFNAYRYNDYLFHKKRDSFLIPIITPYIKEFEETHKKENICVIFCEKKESCLIMSDILIHNFGIDPRDIGIVNSDISESDKVINKQKRYICSTAKSLGRGVDISSMTMGLNLEVYAGTSIFEQQVFRLGRTGGEEGKYVNFVDISFYMIENWNKGKLDYLDTLFKSYEYKYFDSIKKEFVKSERDL